MLYENIYLSFEKVRRKSKQNFRRWRYSLQVRRKWWRTVAERKVRKKKEIERKEGEKERETHCLLVRLMKAGKMKMEIDTKREREVNKELLKRIQCFWQLKGFLSLRVNAAKPAFFIDSFMAPNHLCHSFAWQKAEEFYWKIQYSPQIRNEITTFYRCGSEFPRGSAVLSNHFRVRRSHQSVLNHHTRSFLSLIFFFPI